MHRDIFKLVVTINTVSLVFAVVWQQQSQTKAYYAFSHTKNTSVNGTQVIFNPERTIS